MNQDAKRATGRGVPNERHAIGITRMCLRSGSVQLPFALSGSLPEGELLVHDAEADEPIVLWSEPPRRLAGLAPLFERHEVQVNDQLVLEVRGDDVRIAVAKRPRRSRPKVSPSTWASHRDEPRREVPTQLDHHDDAPRDATPEDGTDEAGAEPWVDEAANATEYANEDGTGHRATFDRQRSEHPERGDEAAGEELHAARHARRTGPAQVRPPDEAAATPGGRAAWARPIDGVPVDEPDDDAPRAPRVTVRPVSDARQASREGAASAAGTTDDLSSDHSPDRSPARRSGGGPFAGLMRRARGWFGGDAGPRDDDRGPSDDDEREARDWLQAWDVDHDESDVHPDAFDTEPALGRAVTLGHAADQPRGEAPDEPFQEPLHEAPLEAAPRPDAGPERAAEGWMNAPEDDSMDDVAGSVEDHDGSDAAREERAAAPEPTHEPTDETMRETTDQPATPAPRRPASRTPLFPAPPGQAPTDHAPTDQGGQAASDAPATPEDSDHPPAEAAAAQVGSAKTPPVDTPPVDTPPERGATLPSGVPIRAERFLGGDLRTRLLRFLTSPEMPLIAKTDLIAKRFDLEPATAQEMLEDIADDPPDGLRLTVVRQGAWRIERRSA